LSNALFCSSVAGVQEYNDYNMLIETLARFHRRRSFRVAHIRPVFGRMWGYSNPAFAFAHKLGIKLH
jgi:hypothetical protein